MLAPNGDRLRLERPHGLHYAQKTAAVFVCGMCPFRSIRETSVRGHTIATHGSQGSYSVQRLRLMSSVNVVAATDSQTPTSPTSTRGCSAKSSATRTVDHCSYRHESEIDPQYAGSAALVAQPLVAAEGDHFVSVSDRIHHNKTSSDDEAGSRQFECYFCSFTSCRPELIDEHSETHKDEVSALPIPRSLLAPESKTSCSRCGHTFASPTSMLQHARNCETPPLQKLRHSPLVTVKTDEVPLCCTECSFATNCRQLLDFHVHLMHSVHECEECGQNFPSRRQLSTHLQSSHSHACQHCGMVFFNRNKLEIHEQSAHLVRLMCTICGIRMPSEQALREHEARHVIRFCTRCDKTFESAAELKLHLALTHPRNNLLGGNACKACFHAFCTPAALVTHRATCVIAAGLCPLCGLRCGSPELLIEHTVKCHPEVAVLNCPRCPHRTTDPIVHMTHQLVHVPLPMPAALPLSSSRCYQCTICERWTASTSSLRTHVYNHHKLKPYRCELCEFCTSSSGNLRSHRAVRHLNTELSVKCDGCNRRYRTVAQMHKHVKKTHEQELNYECEFCENRFVTELRLKRHLAIVHFEDAEAVTGDEPYAGISRFRCDECGYSSYSTSRFRLHRATHKERLQCSHCHLSFPLLDVLNRHINTRHLKRHVPCTMCGRRLPNEARLTQHIQSCHAEHAAPIACSMCGFCFESLAHLEYHHRSHLTVKNFECPTCLRSFTTAASLCVHRLRHAKVETTSARCSKSPAVVASARWLFHCKQCRLHFKNRSSLVAHQAAMHSSAASDEVAESRRGTAATAAAARQLLSCEYCDKVTFSSKLLLSYHIRHSHLDECRALTCQHCDRRFYSRASLSSHIVSAHTKAYQIFCPLCNKGMLSLLRLRLHMLHAHRESTRKRRSRAKSLPSPGIAKIVAAPAGTEYASQHQKRNRQERRKQRLEQPTTHQATRDLHSNISLQEIVVTDASRDHDAVSGMGQVVIGSRRFTDPSVDDDATNLGGAHEVVAKKGKSSNPLNVGSSGSGTVDPEVTPGAAAAADKPAHTTIDSVVEIAGDQTADLISQIFQASDSGATYCTDRRSRTRAEDGNLAHASNATVGGEQVLVGRDRRQENRAGALSSSTAASQSVRGDGDNNDDDKGDYCIDESTIAGGERSLVESDNSIPSALGSTTTEVQIIEEVTGLTEYVVNR